MPGKLFSPIKLGNLELKNRILVAPMATRYASSRGAVTETMLSYYAHLAVTGVSLIVVEAAFVSIEGRAWSRQLANTDDECITGLSQIAEAIKDRGCVPFLQIHHGGRQALLSSNGTVVGPSPIPCAILGHSVRELTLDEVRGLVLRFGDAALAAQKAGFLGVELHGAHGYLLHQFNSPVTNFRLDEYGLGNNGFSQFSLDIIRQIKSLAPDLNIIYRLSARDYLPSGLMLKDTKRFSRALAAAGVDSISVSGGMYASLHGKDSLFGPNAPMAVFREDSGEIRRCVPCPIILAGKIQYPGLAEEILESEDAHLIGLGRMLLRDPEWVRKAKRELLEPVRQCLLCSRCHFHQKGCPDGAVVPTWAI